MTDAQELRKSIPRTSAAWDWLGVKQRSTNSAHGHSLSRTRYHRYASQRLPRLKAEATVLTNETYRLLSPMCTTRTGLYTTVVQAVRYGEYEYGFCFL